MTNLFAYSLVLLPNVLSPKGIECRKVGTNSSGAFLNPPTTHTGKQRESELRRSIPISDDIISDRLGGQINRGEIYVTLRSLSLTP